NYLHFFFFQAEDGIRDRNVTGVQTCALPIFLLDADDHPLAPARVPNARAHAKRQIVAERLAEGRVRLAHDPAARFRPRVERRQVLLRHLAQEARRLAHAISVDTPVQRVREVEPLAGARDANIAEPPLFLDLLGILERPRMGEHALLEAGEED